MREDEQLFFFLPQLLINGCSESMDLFFRCASQIRQPNVEKKIGREERRGWMIQLQVKTEEMMIGDAMKLAMNDALEMRGRREAFGPNVIDATTSVTMRSKNLMCETRMRRSIGKEGAEGIVESFLH
jgi:hypothetical protein